MRGAFQGYYGTRSSTGHGGKLHGEERWFGMRMSPDRWVEDEPQKFMWRHLPRMRGLARRVVKRALESKPSQRA